MAVTLNFDATNVSPDLGFEVLPAGWYNVAIDESDMKPTKDGSGAYLEVRFNVLDGQYVGKKIFMRMNLRNANPVAQEIAFKQLSAIAHAVGVLRVETNEQLHGRPLKIKVKVRKDKDGQYDDQNDVTSIKSINEPVPVPGADSSLPVGFGQPPAPMYPQIAPVQPEPAQAQGWGNPVPAQAPQQAPAGWVQTPNGWVQTAPTQPAPQAAPVQFQTQQPWAQPAQQAAQPAPVQHPAQQAQPPWAV